MFEQIEVGNIALDIYMDLVSLKYRMIVLREGQNGILQHVYIFSGERMKKFIAKELTSKEFIISITPVEITGINVKPIPLYPTKPKAKPGPKPGSKNNKVKS